VFFVRDDEYKETPNVFYSMIKKTFDEFNPDEVTPVDEFRVAEYERLPMFFDVCLRYLNKLAREPFIEDWEMIVTEPVNYANLLDTEVHRVTIRVKYKSESDYVDLFTVDIPKLIEGFYFKIYGIDYVPAMYLYDYPLVIRKTSFLMQGLLGNISVYMNEKEEYINFMGLSNFSFKHFVNLYFDTSDQEDMEIVNDFIHHFKPNKKPFEPVDLENSAYFFRSRYNIELSENETEINVIEKIRAFLDNLFFDDYTRKMYAHLYALDESEINIKNIVRDAMIGLIEDPINFVDLRYKQLFFIRLLLSKLFRRISTLGMRLVIDHPEDGKSIISFSQSSRDMIVKTFMDGDALSGNYLSDTVNTFGILKLKISLTPMGKTKSIPSESSQIHETHFGRICPITIPSTDIGKVAHLVPGTKVGAFGEFIF